MSNKKCDRWTDRDGSRRGIHKSSHRLEKLKLTFTEMKIASRFVDKIIDRLAILIASIALPGNGISVKLLEHDVSHEKFYVFSCAMRTFRGFDFQ